MNDQTQDAKTDEGVRPNGLPPQCARAEELVAYLYDEATENEARSFGEHLRACASCRDELAAFGVVRAGVREWRNEAFGLTPSLAFEAAGATLASVARETPRKRSALAALREFFTLSPAWLQVGSVAAALLICALAALTFARTEVRWDENGLAFQTGVRERIVRQPVEVRVPGVPSQEQIDALVAEGVKREMAALKIEQSEAAEVKASTDAKPSTVAPPRVVEAKVRTQPGGKQTQRVAPRRPEVAGVNQLYDRDEENLPRLSDLLNEVN
jgi:hypothetical protein